MVIVTCCMSWLYVNERSERTCQRHSVEAGVHGLEHIARGLVPLNDTVHSLKYARGIRLIVNEAEVDELAIGIHIDLEVYPLVASGGVHEPCVVSARLALELVGVDLAGLCRGDLCLAHESSIHRIGRPMGLWWTVRPLDGQIGLTGQLQLGGDGEEFIVGFFVPIL